MVGKVTTQGDRATRARAARQLFGLDGKGITIGVISDSFNARGEAAQDQRSGDLPGRGNPDGFSHPVRVLKDDRSGIDEGRALLQIIFDLAPRTELLFHTTGRNERDFVDAVATLTAAGVDIIIDDIQVSTSPFFQDGLAAQAVTDAIRRGVVYVSAAGNQSNRSYDNTFRPTTPFTMAGYTYKAHDFDPAPGIDLFQNISMPADAAIDLILNWDQPSGQVDANLEFFILDKPALPNAGGHILAAGTVLSPDAKDPFQRLFFATDFPRTVYLVIAQKTASTGKSAHIPDRIKWISFANAADGNTVYQYVNEAGLSGGSTIYGHQNVAGAIAVGAVSFDQTPAFGVSFPQLESFSSVGGSPIVFDRQGNRFPVPIVLPKPDIQAPDRVSTTVMGFKTFPGTSAAAPHVAAIVALMLQRVGGAARLSPSKLLTLLQTYAVPVDATPFDIGGLVQARTAVLQAGTTKMGTSGNDVLSGNSLAENGLGLGGNDTIGGAGGFDALWGGEGADCLWGHQGNDYLLGQQHADELVGGRGRDYLRGGIGADQLRGNQGPDWLRGNQGNDVLAGDRGQNQLIGGAGKDIFVLHRQGLAVIRDFRPDIDHLVLPRQICIGQLELEQRGRDALIQFADRVLAQLQGIRVDRLSATDCILGDEIRETI